MSRLFRIQYAHSMTPTMKPCAPFLAITGPVRPALLGSKAHQWDRIFYLQHSNIQIQNAPTNTHCIGPTSPFYCEKENVAIVGNPVYSRFWEDFGALVCSITPTIPPLSFLRFPVRLALYDSPAQHACSHRIVNDVPCLTNSTDTAAWMEFPIMDAQEVEAITKADQTLLRCEEIELPPYQSF
jgi:hypothetical protein